MRGKGHGVREQHVLDGITPAYAGKSVQKYRMRFV